MKLHLPKQLFTALLAAITLATPAAWGANELNLQKGADAFYADDYAFSFILNDDAFADPNTVVVVGGYWGKNASNNVQNSNGIVATRDEQGNITLTIGQGKASSVGDSADLSASSTFAFFGSNKQTFTTPLQTGVVYTVKAVGANGAMDPALYDIAAGSSENVGGTGGTYPGNMNGGDDLYSAFNDDSAVLVSASGTQGNLAKTGTLVWAGTPTNGEAEWKADSTKWNNISGDENGVAAVAANDVIFDASSATAKTVKLEGSLAVNSISIYGDYTFKATDSTTLSTTEGLSIASGKTLTLQGDNITLSGTANVYGTLAVTTTSGLGTVNVKNGGALKYDTALSSGETDYDVLDEFNNDTNITTETGGYIQLSMSWDNELRLANELNITLSKNFEYLTQVLVHGGGQEKTLTIGSDAVMKGTDIRAVSKATISVAGGSLMANTVMLGHTTNGENWGKLMMSDGGSITVGSITFIKNTGNELDITGGSLEFTTGQALVYTEPGEDNKIDTTARVSISGATLKATQTDWTLDGSGLTTTPTIGNVTIDSANTHGITLKNVSLNGAVTNNATAETAALTLDGVSLASGTNFSLATAGTTTLKNMTLNLTQSSAVTGNGTLEIGAGSSISMGPSSGSSSVQSNVKVLGGGLLSLTGGDALGWGTSHTKMITLLGDGSGDAQLAKMQVTNTQSMKTNLSLQGNSRVSGGDLEFFGGAITATGTNNIISSNIYQRNAGTITVTNSGDELEISGNMGHRSNYAALVTKAGKGKLTLSGSANVFYNGFTVSAGNVDLNGRTTVQGTNALTISEGATLNVNAALYITQAIANNGTLTFGNAGALHIDVTQFNGVTVSMVDANGEAAETNGFKAVSTITISSGSNKMAGTMVTLDGLGQREVTEAGTIAEFVDYSTYYMNSGTETLSKAAVDSTGMQHVTMSGGELSIDGGSLSTVTMSGGSLAVAGASVETLTMSGGSSVNYAGSITGNVSLKNSNTNFTISGDTTVGGNVETGNSSGASVTVNENATLTVQGSLKSSWGLSSVTVNGILNITDTAAGLHLASNSNETITGSGTINAGKFTAGNGGKAYTVDVNEFNIGEGGLEFHPQWETTVNLKSLTTVIEGGVSIRNGSGSGQSTLNFGDGETNSQAMVHGLVNNEATINVNSGSVTLNGGMTGAGTLALKGGQLTLATGTSNSVGSFSYSGGTLNYESLTAGAIDIANEQVMSNSGHLTVTGSLAGRIENTNTGQVTFAKGASIAAGATVNISGTGTTLLAGTLSNAGTLSLAGQLGLSSELQLDYTERSNASNIVYILDKNNLENTNTDGDGFLQETGSSYWLIQGGTTTLANGITTSAGYTLTQVTEENKQDGDTVGDVYFTVSSSIGNTFYITSGELNIVGTGGTKPDGVIAYNAEAVALNSNDAVLNLVSGSLMTSNITFSESVTDNKAGAIKLSDGAVLNVDSLTSMGVTANQLLSGLVSATPTGKILISQSGLSTGQITTAFDGTLELAADVTFTFGEKSASHTNEGYEINTTSIEKVILNNGSRLEYQGNGTNSEFKDLTVNGTGTTGATIYIIDGSNGAESNAVKLTGDTTLNHTLNLTGQYGSRYTISNLKGAGTLIAGGGETTTELFYTTIQGLDDFTGTLNFTDTAKHTVSVSTGEASGGVSFAGLNMAGGTDVNNTFNVQTDTTVGTVSVAGSSNSIVLSEGKSLSVGIGTVTNGSLSTGSATVASKSADTPASLSHVKMTGSGFSKATSAGSAKGSISDANVEIAQLAEDASFTIQDMTLTNTTITAATTTTQVKLQNVTASDVVLAKGKFVVTNQAAVGTGGSEGCDFFTRSYSGITLANTEDGEGSSIVLNLGDLSCLTPMGPAVYDSITISLEGFTMSEYSSGILFAGDSWLGELLTAQGAKQYVASGDVAAPANVGGGAGGSAVGVSFSSGNVGTIITITGLNVPEPTTATLSLLALAALAARRRRND